MLPLRAVYGLALRATEGVARSLLALLEVAFPVPSYSTLSRRAATLEGELGAKQRRGPLHVVIDSSGFKIDGEGEGKVRQHGWRKRRTWRKLHGAVNEAPGEIVAAVASEADVSDAEGVPDLLEGVEGELQQISADGASDPRQGSDEIEQRGAIAVLPPRRNAKSWQPGHSHAPPWQREVNLRALRAQGRRRGKQETGYPRRSLAETAIYRVKTLFGASLRARLFEQQATELFSKVAALNRMTHLGMPESYPLTA